MSKQLGEFYRKMSSGKKEFLLSRGNAFFVHFGLQDENIPVGISRAGYDRFNLKDFGFLVQEIDLPNIKIGDDEELDVRGNVGSFKGPANSTIMPEDNSFSISILRTEHSPIERFFVPWMEEVVAADLTPDKPFRRAVIYVDVLRTNASGEFPYNESDIAVTYEIHGAYPTHVDTPTLSYGTGDNNTSSIGFNFNRIKVVPK